MMRTIVLTLAALLSLVVASFLDRKSEVKWQKCLWYISFILGVILIIASGIDAFRIDRKLEKLASPWTWGELHEGKKLN